MTIEEIKQLTYENPDRVVSEAKARKSGYCCPNCGNGGGDDGTGVELKDGRFHCFKCNKNGDTIDIYRAIHNIPSSVKLPEVIAEIAPIYGVALDAKKTARDPGTMTDKEKDELARRYCKDDIANAQKNLDAPECVEYLGKRGISLATAARYRLGFISQWRSPTCRVNGSNTPWSPRLILPTGAESYLARDIRSEDQIPEEYRENAKKYAKQKAGDVCLFNRQSVKSARRPLFIVEGEIDALSIIEVGGEAVALGSASNTELIRLAFRYFHNEITEEPFIVAMDNDEAGERGAESLCRLLDAEGRKYYRIDTARLFNGHKDANEALVADRDAFAASVRRAECMELYEQSNAAYLDRLRNQFSTTLPPIPTGFAQFDDLLDGGLRAGLYFIGGVSSAGKTAFAMQIVDQIAAAGTDCLVFAAEMSRADLVARSVSRLTLDTGSNYRAWSTQRQIQSGKTDGYFKYSAEKIEAADDAFKVYSRFAEHITIYENYGDAMKPSSIRDRIKRYCQLTGRRPVVLVDYLQILTPEDRRQDIRLCVDDTIRALKGIATELTLPIIVISSLNRDNYTAPLNLAAFKESGNIEYGADYLFGLQFSCVHNLNADGNNKAEMLGLIAMEKQQNPRAVEVTILKQRGGKSAGTVLFAYDAWHNSFSESQSITDYLRANYGGNPQEEEYHRALMNCPNTEDPRFAPDFNPNSTGVVREL